MERNKLDEQIIKNYKEQEKMMILIYAQWCINNSLDPVNLYQEAYPNQVKNDLLVDVLKDTVRKEESEPIHHEIVVQMLQAFGNDDLAYHIQKRIEKLGSKD